MQEAIESKLKMLFYTRKFTVKISGMTKKQQNNISTTDLSRREPAGSCFKETFFKKINYIQPPMIDHLYRPPKSRAQKLHPLV